MSCVSDVVLFFNLKIYGGLSNFWDYSPLGVELKRNVKDA
ncbi:hypothetical protein PRO82_000522 [Candidatus Protochlamydia amoebophila]|nr:hypothetical protein [Candidatus Protochlamydia amoebophila]